MRAIRCSCFGCAHERRPSKSYRHYYVRVKLARVLRAYRKACKNMGVPTTAAESDHLLRAMWMVPNRGLHRTMAHASIFENMFANDAAVGPEETATHQRRAALYGAMSTILSRVEVF